MVSSTAWPPIWLTVQDLDRVIVVNRSFAQVITGQAKGFDIALSEITITEERKKVLNFTEPYFNSDQGVLVKAGTHVDKDNIKKMRLAAEQATTTLQYILDNIKPIEHPKVFASVAPMYAALAAGQVDAVLYDTPNVLARAKESNGMFKVVGRYDMGEKWGGRPQQRFAEPRDLQQTDRGFQEGWHIGEAYQQVSDSNSGHGSRQPAGFYAVILRNSSN